MDKQEKRNILFGLTLERAQRHPSFDVNEEVDASLALIERLEAEEANLGLTAEEVLQEGEERMRDNQRRVMPVNLGSKPS